MFLVHYNKLAQHIFVVVVGSFNTGLRGIKDNVDAERVECTIGRDEELVDLMVFQFILAIEVELLCEVARNGRLIAWYMPCE